MGRGKAIGGEKREYRSIKNSIFSNRTGKFKKNAEYFLKLSIKSPHKDGFGY